MFSFEKSNEVQVVLTVALLVLFLALERFGRPRIAKGGEQSRYKNEAINQAIKTARIILGVFTLLILVMIWGVEARSVMVFATTLVTLLGVALFANWSLLSNVTAYFILLFHPSFRRGNFIRVMDADNYVEGYISEVKLFSTILITEDREIATYPNNMLLGRPALINPRDRLYGVGKLPAAVAKTEPQQPTERPGE